MFSKQLIEYTESTFKQSKIEIMTKTMVKEVKERSVVLKMPTGEVKEVPCGMVVWAAVCVLSFICVQIALKTDDATVVVNRAMSVVRSHAT
jgi:NADH dehydrogenase FAD-containing subunit